MAENDELWQTLMRFHSEVLRPDLEAIRDELRGEMVTRAEFLTHMDAIYTRLDRLERQLN